ncbi:MAG: hypothetical protein LDL41_18250, partial [Coleofasciculus sp. S288]|nr:hypothetical protein [Coleofasciculus sp. S288]
LRILIVDDETGENGGILDKEEAKKLVGDCYGRMSSELAKELTGKSNTPFQFRMGIKPQEGNKHYRIAKGTLATSTQIENLGQPRIYTGTNGQTKVKTGYDLILATSSFKGRKDETKIKPGEYNLTVGIGVKTLAQYGKISPNIEEFEAEPEQTNETLYQILKACVKNHPQLLEHPKLVGELNQFTKNEWKDIATGRAIEFQRGLAQPSLDLKEDEICIPHIPEEKEVIVTRSPLVNANGVIILKNKHLPEFMGEQGTIHINPKTAATHLQADFDGDNLAFEVTDKYPTLTAEIKETLLPENRYRDIVKRAKEAYEAKTFGDIAISCSENKIGLIANDIQKAVALRWETLAIPQEEKRNYLKQMAKGFSKVLSDLENQKLSLPESLENVKHPKWGSFKDKLTEVSQFQPKISDEKVEDKLEIIRNIYFDVICEEGNELQVAVDGPKSAARPNEKILAFCKAVTGVRNVAWLQDKKQEGVYDERPMNTANYSPVDLMVKLANQTWQAATLEALPTHQFEGLFDKNYTQEQENLAKEIRNTYNELIGKAVRQEEQAKKEPGPRMVVTSAKSGKQIEIAKITEYNHPNTWDSKTLNIKLVENSSKTQKSPHKLLALAQVREADGSLGTWKELGVVSTESVKEHNLKAGISLSQASVEVRLGITQEEIDAKFDKARDYVDMVRAETPASEQQSLASALWHVTHASDQKGYSEYSKASVAFSIFPNQVIEQLSEFQFDELTVSGVHQPTNEWGHALNNQEISFKVELETREEHANYGKRVITIEDKQLGPLSEKDFQLPIDTEGKGTLIPSPSTSVTAATDIGDLKVTQLKNYDCFGQSFQGETVKIAVGFRDKKAVAMLGDKVIGTFDKDARNALKAAGKLRPGAELEATLTSNPSTTATLKIEPDSLKYPETWRQNKEASNLGNQARAKNQQAAICADARRLANASQVQQRFAIASREAVMNRLASVVEGIRQEVTQNGHNLNIAALKQDIQEAQSLDTSDRILQPIEGAVDTSLPLPLSQGEIDRTTEEVIELAQEELASVASSQEEAQAEAEAEAQKDDLSKQSESELKETIEALRTQIELQNQQIALLTQTVQDMQQALSESTSNRDALNSRDSSNLMGQVEALSKAIARSAQAKPIAHQLSLQGYKVEDLSKEAPNRELPSPQATQGSSVVAPERNGHSSTSVESNGSKDTSNGKAPPNSEAFYQRPDWEKNMVAAAFSTLKTVAEDPNHRRVTAFGRNYVAVYNSQDKSLRILDSIGDRGLVYKAEQGKAPSVCQFSEPEKVAFNQLSQTSPSKQPALER